MSDEIADLIILLLGIFACMSLSYFFGLVTVALEHYSSSKLEEIMKNSPESTQKRLLGNDENSRIIFSASVFCRLVSNIGVFAFLTFFLLSKIRHDSTVSLDSSVLLWGSFALALVIVLYFVGYSIPRSIARRDEESIFIRYSTFISFLAIPLFPLTFITVSLDRIIGKITGSKPEGGEKLTEEDLLDMVSDGELKGVIEEVEKVMIENIISFNDLPVSEVMTNRSEITVISAETTLEECTKMVVAAGHSRIPVIKGDRDNVVGILYAKDLLKFWNNPKALETPVEKIMRKTLFVPESKNIAQLFAEFQLNHIHFAIVLDEYGGTAGLITIEDVLEEIVGEMEDEFDHVKTPEIQKIDDSNYILSAKIQIDDLNEALETDFPLSDRYETLGGMIMDSLGHIPLVDEMVVIGRYSFRVSESNSRTVKRIALEILPENLNEDNEDGN